MTFRAAPAPLVSLALLPALLLLAQCGAPPLAEPEVTLEQLAALDYGPAATHFQELADVKVEVSAARLDDHWVVARGRFTPQEAGYHLYSKDMPADGIDGIGRPTRLEAARGQAGAVLADREPHEFTQFDLTVPVYPEGPVTLYRLVAPGKGAAEIQVALTYMSCSAELCNQPVEDEALAVALP